MENTSTIILYETGFREPKLKYNMKHIKSLSIDWFLDCIQTFTIQEPELNEESWNLSLFIIYLCFTYLLFLRIQ